MHMVQIKMNILLFAIITSLLLLNPWKFKMPRLSITAYNMRTLRCAAPYINVLMETSDIIVLAEHRLYSNELYKLKEINDSYEYHAKASADLCDSQGIRKPGHCGIPICWKKIFVTKFA